MLYKNKIKSTKHIKERSSFNAYAHAVFIHGSVTTG